VVTVKEEAKLIAKDVGKGIWSIFSPPIGRDEKPSEYIELHYCDKCKRYHRAE
jgi:hypothetical protein